MGHRRDFWSQMKNLGDDHRRQNEYQEKLLDATWANMWKNCTYMTYLLEQFAEEEESDENNLFALGMSALHKKWTDGWTEYDAWHHERGLELKKQLEATENIPDKKELQKIYDKDQNAFRVDKFGNFALMVGERSQLGWNLKDNMFDEKQHDCKFHNGESPKWRKWIHRHESLCRDLHNLDIHCANLAEYGWSFGIEPPNKRN